MSTRRHFMTSVGLSTLAMAAPTAALSWASTVPMTVPGLWVVDTRLAASTVGAAPPGVPVVRLDGDVSAVWFDAIRPHLEAQRTPVAGHTQEDALFCLQRLAADYRWRLQLCADAVQDLQTPAANLSPSCRGTSWRLIPPSVA